MVKLKKKINRSLPALLAVFGLVCLIFVIIILLRGKNVTLFNPKGIIAEKQLKLMTSTVAILLIIAVPTLFLLYFFAWKYRDSSLKTLYKPESSHKKLLALVVWLIPTCFMLILASIMWPAAHQLAPQKQLVSKSPPLVIQVIAMRWKWLFIYPKQNIASINFVQIPIDVPVEFELSADETPMSSFWIPALGGQLYAMTGHVNKLNLLTEQQGDFTGSSAEINGAGFAGMKFIARASTSGNFDQWVIGVKQSSAILDSAEYSKLLVPSENNSSKFYAKADQNVYDNMIRKYSDSHSSHMEHE